MQIALQVREYLKSGVVQNAVNLPSLCHEEYEELAPYMDLAERLGTFLAQIPRGSIDSIQIALSRTAGETKTELIRNCAIAGVLGHLEQVNRINAASVAAERGHPPARREEGSAVRRSRQRAAAVAAHE